MNSNEEELQQKIEEGKLLNSQDIDVKSYRQVFRALTKEPPYKLSSGFEERIVKLVAEERKKESSRDFFWFGFGIFSLIIAFIVAIAFTGFKFNLGFLTAMADYKGLVIFGVAFIGLLNWLDKKLVHAKEAKL